MPFLEESKSLLHSSGKLLLAQLNYKKQHVDTFIIKLNTDFRSGSFLASSSRALDAVFNFNEILLFSRNNSFMSRSEKFAIVITTVQRFWGEKRSMLLPTEHPINIGGASKFTIKRLKHLAQSNYDIL